MFKSKMPAMKTKKMPKVKPKLAFGAGAAMHQAFRDPGTMAEPDQAFTAAMAGSGGGSAGADALPPPSLPPTG